MSVTLMIANHVSYQDDEKAELEAIREAEAEEAAEKPKKKKKKKKKKVTEEAATAAETVPAVSDACCDRPSFSIHTC